MFGFVGVISFGIRELFVDSWVYYIGYLLCFGLWGDFSREIGLILEFLQVAHQVFDKSP